MDGRRRWRHYCEGTVSPHSSRPVRAFGGTAQPCAGKPVKASGTSIVANPPSAAADGLSTTSWTAGGFPPQWIEVDLGANTSIGHVALLIAQTPEGATQHRVPGRSDGEGWRLLHQFEGVTADSQTLEVTPPEPWKNVRYLRIETVKSPSWVGWREIEAYPSAR